jgi:hypothetical protein
MKRIAIALAVATLTVSSIGVASAKPGNGAQKAGLTEASGTNLSCSAGKADAGPQTATGFAVLNAPGKPGSPRKIVGEVAVKDAEPGTYELRLAGPDSGSCGESVGTLVVGQNRQGNASVAAGSQGEGVYYVVLVQRPLADVPAVGSLLFQERYASAPVTLR